MVCRYTMRAKSPSGEDIELPVSDLIEEALDDDVENGEVEDPEQWLEQSRETEVLDLDGDITVERIIAVTFLKPSGRSVRLVFAEAQ